ncbi:hypothetical protein JYU34_018777 [Plutella xylostella]|uniref:Uncharacterized protein n=1 Tax=Plutella xylostella TaxID=51655 RepID=A0ABQ7PYG5_PLUXY|nr:hypothetical protein JYU34_018777 [Plutella xylostella]
MQGAPLPTRGDHSRALRRKEKWNATQWRGRGRARRTCGVKCRDSAASRTLRISATRPLRDYFKLDN